MKFIVMIGEKRAWRGSVGRGVKRDKDREREREREIEEDREGDEREGRRQFVAGRICWLGSEIAGSSRVLYQILSMFDSVIVFFAIMQYKH